MHRLVEFLVVKVLLGSIAFLLFTIIHFVLYIVHETIDIVNTMVLKSKASNLNIKDEIVVLTGGSGGFGKSMTKMLLAKGAYVISVDVIEPSPEEKKKLSADAKDGGKVAYFKLDITNESAVQKFVQDNIKPLGRPVYALVNNAGIFGAPCAAVECSSSNLQNVIGVNFSAPVILTAAMYPFMRQGGGGTDSTKKSSSPTKGRVINVTSCAGLITDRGMMAYNSSKFAFEAYSDCLRMEMVGKLDVAIIEPFFADTGIIAVLDKVDPKVLESSILADFWAKGKRRFDRLRKDHAAAQKKGEQPTNTMDLMTPEFVADVIVHSALLSTAPQDRYLVCPSPVVSGLMKFVAHSPNYFLVMDKLKNLLGQRE